MMKKLSWPWCVLLFIVLTSGFALAESPLGSRMICKFGGPCTFSNLRANTVTTSATSGNAVIVNTNAKICFDSSCGAWMGENNNGSSHIYATSSLLPNGSWSLGAASAHWNNSYVNGLTLGANGTALTQIKTCTSFVTFGTIAANSCNTYQIDTSCTVANFNSGCVVQVAATSRTTGLTYECAWNSPTPTSNATLYVCNVTTANITPTPANVTVFSIEH